MDGLVPVDLSGPGFGERGREARKRNRYPARRTPTYTRTHGHACTPTHIPTSAYTHMHANTLCKHAHTYTSAFMEHGRGDGLLAVLCKLTLGRGALGPCGASSQTESESWITSVTWSNTTRLCCCSCSNNKNLIAFNPSP